MESRHQDRGRRGTGSGLSFCKLLNNLSNSTVLIHHWNNMDAAAPCGVVRCDALQVCRINLMEKPFREVFKESLYRVFSV